MSKPIYIRDLVPDDAKVSCNWRNNPMIWKYTEFNASTPVTSEMELEWIHKVLKRQDQKRFAICISGTDEYIGNVQLLKIENKQAEFHLFIGEPRWWGKGFGNLATQLLLDFAFFELKLEKIYLEAHRENYPALSIYSKVGFKNREIRNSFNLMELDSSDYKLSK